MNPVVEVLFTIATELADLAKTSMPELKEGEQVRREWYKSGVYYRETVLDGVVFLNSYDIKKRKLGEACVRDIKLDLDKI